MEPSESPAEDGPEAASPFPPAFRWETSQPEASAPVAGPSYRPPQGAAGDLFQPVGASHNQPSSTSADSSAPPWSSSDLPSVSGQFSVVQPSAVQPNTDQPNTDQPNTVQQSAWLRQGPEVSPDSGMQPRSKQLIGLAVLGVVVLGLLGATVMYVLTARSPDRTDLGAAQPTAVPRDLPSPPPPLPPPADTMQALIDPPGETRGGGGLLDLPQLQSAKLLRPPSIVNALQAAGMTDGVLKTTTAGDTTIGMFALTLPDQQAATVVAQTIATAQFEGGLKADDSRSLRGMTVMTSVPGTTSTVYRAVYVLYNRTIYVEVFGTNRNAVRITFDALIHQQVMHAPPTVR